MTRLTPTVRSRLRSIWPSLSPRARAAVLVLLGIGTTGGVVIVDRTRRDPPPPIVDDRPDVRPPPRGDDPSVPPSGEWPKITETKTINFDAHKLPKSSVGIKYAVTVPEGHTQKMVTLLDYGGTLHENVLLDNCWIETHPRVLFGGRWYNAVNGIVRQTKFTGAALEHYIYASPVFGGVYEDLVFGEIGKVNSGGACIQVAMRNLVEYKSDGTIAHNYSHEMSAEGFKLAMQESTRVYRRITSNHVSHYPSQRWGVFAFVSEHYPQLESPSGERIWSVPHNIVIEDCNVVAGHVNYTDGNGKLVRSPRQLLVQGRKSLVVRNSDFYCPDPHDGWFGRVNNVDSVTFDGVKVVGGKLEITEPKAVTIKGCSGDLAVTVLVGGKAIYAGPVSTDWTWSAQ